MQIPRKSSLYMLRPNQTKIITLCENTKEIITLHILYDQIVQKLLL